MDDLTATGFKLIREMSRAEMIDELAVHQRGQLEAQDTPTLRSYVASARLDAYKKRLMAEAGLRETGGLFGGLTVVEDADDDD